MLQFTSQYYEENSDSIHIHHFATDIQYKGVGKEIINKIKEIALSNSKKSIKLDNIGSNKGLNEYYERNGFHQIEIIEPKKYDGKKGEEDCQKV